PSLPGRKDVIMGWEIAVRVQGLPSGSGPDGSGAGPSDLSALITRDTEPRLRNELPCRWQLRSYRFHRLFSLEELHRLSSDDIDWPSIDGGAKGSESEMGDR